MMPVPVFLQRVQAFLAELKARPHLLAEAAALMEGEGGLEQMEPMLDWVPGAGQEVFALQDGPSRPASAEPPTARPGGPASSGEPVTVALDDAVTGQEVPLSPTSPAFTPTEEIESEEEAAQDESRQVGMNPAHAVAPDATF